MSYSHEAFRRPHGIDVLHKEIEERPNGLLVPHVIAISRVAVRFAEYRMQTELVAPDEFEIIAYAGTSSPSDEPSPFLTNDVQSIEDFSTIGASTTLDAIDFIRDVPVRSRLESYRVMVVRNIVPDLREAIIEMNELTSNVTKKPYEHLTTEDL